jgi:hypothetical protein
VAAIQLVFSAPTGPSKTKGPYVSLRFEGEVMRESAGGPVITRHVDHHWELEGETYTRIDCDCRATLHFERMDGSRSDTYGPFESVSFQDGVAYADREMFAFADRTIVDWYSHQDDRHWPLMILSLAE